MLLVVNFDKMLSEFHEPLGKWTNYGYLQGCLPNFAYLRCKFYVKPNFINVMHARKHVITCKENYM